MITRPKVSSLLPSQVPEFVREDYTTFVEFLKAYYEFLDQNYDTNFTTLRDLDKTLDSFIDQFKNELAINLPYSVVNERFLLEKIKDQYLAKGSEASFKLLFKILFDKKVTVEYPSKQILRASDGKWNQDVGVFARVNAGSPDDIVGKIVDVVTPTKILRVQVDKRQYVEVEVDNVTQISGDIYEFYIDRRFFGSINIGDSLRYGDTFEATIVPTTAKIEIQKPGKKFKVGDLYPIRNGNGAGSILKISRVSATGGIEAAEFVRYGINYETDFTANIIPISGTSANSALTSSLTISGSSPNYSIGFNESTDGFFEQGIINITDYTETGEYWDGTYSGQIIREFFVDNKYSVLDPDEPAYVKINLGALAKYPGYYTTNDGFLDDAIFIQDSRYYQAFAYVLKIDERLDTYRSAVKTLVHPAGMALFGEFDIRNEFDTGTSLEFALRYLFVALQDEQFIADNVSTKLLNKTLISGHLINDNATPEQEEAIPTDVNFIETSKLINNTTSNYDDDVEPNEVFPVESQYLNADGLTYRDGISIIDFSKHVQSAYLNDGVTLDTNLVTMLSDPAITLSKPLQHYFSMDDSVSAIDMSKLISSGHLINDNVTTDSESVTPTENYVSLLSKPLGSQLLYDEITTEDSSVSMDTIPDASTILFSKLVNDTLLYDGVTLDDNTFTVTEDDYLNADGLTYRKGISTFAITKVFNSPVYDHYLYGGVVLDTDTVTPSESISAIDMSKSLSTHYLYDGVTSDNNEVPISDTTGTDSARTVPYIVLNKSITNITTNYDGDLDDETITVTGGGGNIWFNPYSEPYPVAQSYFLNDSGNYVEGESAFTG